MSEELIDIQTLEEIRKELYVLIRHYCTSEKLSDSDYRLHLHDSTYVDFTQTETTEIDRLYGVVKEYCKNFPYLISHLSYETKLERKETNQVIGTIDFEKTRVLRHNDPSGLVCVTLEKNLFTPENVLLSAVILGINSLTIKFYKFLDNDEKADFHRQRLRELIDFTNFLLRDRFVSKLSKYYYQNYASIIPLYESVFYRLRLGKIHPKYHKLIHFLHIWKKYNKILYEPDSSLEILLPSLEQFKSPETVYEWWTFYKTIELFPNMEQHQNNESKFSNGEFLVEYQYTKKIKWFADKKPTLYEIQRRPDTVVKKGGKIIAILDAKYMKFDKKYDNNIENQETGVPDRNIVNQMIIYLDYGKKSDKTDLGIVFFADDLQTDHVVLKKEGDPSKRLLCYNLHPNNNPSQTMSKVKEILMKESL